MAPSGLGWVEAMLGTERARLPNLAVEEPSDAGSEKKQPAVGPCDRIRLGRLPSGRRKASPLADGMTALTSPVKAAKSDADAPYGNFI